MVLVAFSVRKSAIGGSMVRGLGIYFYISKEMSSLYFGLGVPCPFKARVLQNRPQTSPKNIGKAMESYTAFEFSG